jgi:dienelactone hydrolase
MASIPLCSSCVSGSIHSGTPTGREDIIHGLNTYITLPEEEAVPKAIIVMIPDAFGWKMVNNRLLCDTYAKKGGYLVYLPDFMNGKSSSSMLTRSESVTLLDAFILTLVSRSSTTSRISQTRRSTQRQNLLVTLQTTTLPKNDIFSSPSTHPSPT